VTQAVAVTRSFLCFALPPLAPLALDYQWVYASTKLVNQVNRNCNWGEWRSQEIHVLETVSACIRFVKSWSNRHGLSKFQQIEFIERIDTPDIPPNDIPSVLFDRFKSDSPK
jgi:hypothetical protein